MTAEQDTLYNLYLSEEEEGGGGLTYMWPQSLVIIIISLNYNGCVIGSDSSVQERRER